MLIPFGVFSAAGVSGFTSDYELISSVFVGTATSNVGFSSIPQTYKHLQLRITARSSLSMPNDNLSYYLNNDTAANYSSHSIYNASPPASNSFTSNVRAYWPSLLIANTNTTNTFTAGVMDILDYSSTSKAKTIRTLIGDGASGPGVVALISNRWGSTSAVTQINFETSANLMANSRFSLYGIKG